MHLPRNSPPLSNVNIPGITFTAFFWMESVVVLIFSVASSLKLVLLAEGAASTKSVVEEVGASPISSSSSAAAVVVWAWRIESVGVAVGALTTFRTIRVQSWLRGGWQGKFWWRTFGGTGQYNRDANNSFFWILALMQSTDGGGAWSSDLFFYVEKKWPDCLIIWYLSLISVTRSLIDVFFT